MMIQFADAQSFSPRRIDVVISYIGLIVQKGYKEVKMFLESLKRDA